MNRPLRALSAIAIGLLAIGIVVVAIALVMWPQWDPIADPLRMAQNASVILGETVSPAMFSDPPSTASSALWLLVGAGVFSFGALAGLFALHAAAVRR